MEPITARSFIRQKHRWIFLPVLLAVMLLAACGQQAQDPAQPTPAGGARQVKVTTVQISAEEVTAAGETDLPDGECVKTELLAQGESVAWWPRDLCAQAQDGAWNLSVPLGEKGAPAALPGSVQYELRAWWPANPEETRSNLYFDLDGPPTPAQPDGG